MTLNWKKDIKLFLISQVLSLFGSALVQYAISWHITLTTKSGLMMTLAILCGFLPNFFLSPFAGVWADRYSRKRLLILSDSMIALATLGLAVSFILGYNELWLLFVILGIRSLGTAVQTPAVSALIPQIVPEQKLTAVNGIYSSVQAGVAVLAPALGAVLYSNTSMQNIFLIDVVTAASAVLTLLFLLKIPVHAKALEKQKSAYLADMKIGFSYVWHNRFLRPFFGYFAWTTFLIAPVAFLTPLLVARSFGEEVWKLTINEISFSVGMIIGGIFISKWKGFNNRMRTIALSCLMMGIGTLAGGIMPNLWLYYGCMLFLGFSIPFLNTPATVLLQEMVEESFMGRVFSVMGMINSAVMPLGMLVFGPIADHFPIEYLLVITGALIAVTGFIIVRNPNLIKGGEAKQPVQID